jgi:hypothetical protein
MGLRWFSDFGRHTTPSYDMDRAIRTWRLTYLLICKTEEALQATSSGSTPCRRGRSQRTSLASSLVTLRYALIGRHSASESVGMALADPPARDESHIIAILGRWQGRPAAASILRSNMMRVRQTPRLVNSPSCTPVPRSQIGFILQGFRVFARPSSGRWKISHGKWRQGARPFHE